MHNLKAYFGETPLKVSKNFLPSKCHYPCLGETHTGREESAWLGSGCYYAQMLPSQPPLPKGFVLIFIILAISRVNKTFTMIISISATILIICHTY